MYEIKKKKVAAFKMCFKACLTPFIFPENFYLLPEEDHRTCELRTASTLKSQDIRDSWNALHNYAWYSTPNTVIMYGTAIVPHNKL